VESTTFKIKTSVFEGPLDLLLQLIQKRKLFISDISLAQIADEYIDHIRNGQNLSIQARSSFIAIASILLLIKSKSLLPTLQLTQDEEEDIRGLEIRLFLYKTIQDAANDTIRPRFMQSPQYSRIVKPNTETVFSPDTSITQSNIHENILSVLKSIPEPPKKHHQVTIEQVESLEHVIESLTKRVQSSLQMSFSQFSDSSHKKTEQGKRVHVIVSFLALLELVRQGVVDADQGNRYGDIDIQKSGLPPRISSM